MYSGSRRYRGVRYVTQYVPIDTSSESVSNIQADKEVTITSNGTTTIVSDPGYDAMATVTVSTNVQSELPTITHAYFGNTAVPLTSFTLAAADSTVTMSNNAAAVRITLDENSGLIQFIVKETGTSSSTFAITTGSLYYVWTSGGPNDDILFGYIDENENNVFLVRAGSQANGVQNTVGVSNTLITVSGFES